MIEIYITSSIGVSVYPSNRLDGETLVRNADIAMYYAKNCGHLLWRLLRDLRRRWQ